MLLTANLSAGDFLDRMSILQIKIRHGLEVNKELESYESKIYLFEKRGLKSFMDMLLAVNEELWELEESKRSDTLRAGPDYNNVSELITQLNDIRYQIKKRADAYFKSEISEMKSHKE